MPPEPRWRASSRRCEHERMFREATVDDLTALLDLERAANLVGLRHVFPPERYPFPEDDVLARWALVLDEPGVQVLVRDAQEGDGLDLFAAYDDRRAVVPGGEHPGPAALRVPRLARGAGPPTRAVAAPPDGDALHPVDPAVGPLMPAAVVARGTPQGRRVLAAAVLGAGMAMLDGTVVNIALRRIGDDLGASIAQLQWVVN